MRHLYVPWRPRADADAIVRQAETFCQEYAAQGLDLTLRALYYRFVAAAQIPNSMESYNKLKDIISKARLAGLLDWGYIVDQDRTPRGIGDGYTSPDRYVMDILDGFYMGHWRTQPTRVEVWVEKQAMASIVGRAANAWQAPYFACRGYVSQSAQWRAGRRIGRYLQGGQNVVILHLGDHDPSGMDMTRDITERLNMFVVQDWYNRYDYRGGSSYGEILLDLRSHLDGRDPLTIKRIALNMEQIEEYNPPPNPAKLTDSRSNEYIAQYGESSWELDALEPSVLDDLIQGEIQSYIDTDLWDAVETEEEEHRAMLARVASRWDEVAAILGTEQE